MATPSPQTIARQTMAALIREARSAGWARVKGEIKPEARAIWCDCRGSYCLPFKKIPAP